MGRRDSDGIRHTKKTKLTEKKKRNVYSSRSVRIQLDSHNKKSQSSHTENPSNITNITKNTTNTANSSKNTKKSTNKSNNKK